VSDAIGDHITLRKVCKGIIERGLKISLSTQMRVDKRSDRKFFDILRAAGFSHLSLGIDGWTDHVLRLQNKGYNMRLVEQNLRDCYEAGIEAHANIVVGVPRETDEDVKRTMENIVRNKEYIKCFSSIYTLMLSVGSPYFQNPENFGICFRGDKQQLYRENPYTIPLDLWYSLDPYIDQKVRVDRLKTICSGIQEGGVTIAFNARAVAEKIVKGETFP